MSGHIAWQATNTTTQCTSVINDKHSSQISEAQQPNGIQRTPKVPYACMHAYMHIFSVRDIANSDREWQNLQLLRFCRHKMLLDPGMCKACCLSM